MSLDAELQVTGCLIIQDRFNGCSLEKSPIVWNKQSFIAEKRREKKKKKSRRREINQTELNRTTWPELKQLWAKRGGGNKKQI